MGSVLGLDLRAVEQGSQGSKVVLDPPKEAAGEVPRSQVVQSLAVGSRAPSQAGQTNPALFRLDPRRPEGIPRRANILGETAAPQAHQVVRRAVQGVQGSRARYWAEGNDELARI